MPKLFKKGDVVVLKSGGPKMTVEKYSQDVGWDYSKESDDRVICNWFDSDIKLQSREFNQETLKLIKDDQEQ